MFLSEPDPRDLDDARDGEDDAYTRPSRRRRIALRVFGILAMAGLVLPGIVVTLQTAARTADRACQLIVAKDAPTADDYRVGFDVAGPEGPGWTCTAIGFGGRETYLTGFGLIPSIGAAWR